MKYCYLVYETTINNKQVVKVMYFKGNTAAANRYFNEIFLKKSSLYQEMKLLNTIEYEYKKEE